MLPQVTKSVLKYKYKSSYLPSTNTSAGSMKMAGTSYDSLREVGDDATFRDNGRKGAMRGCRCFHGYLLLAQTFHPETFLFPHIAIDYLMYLTL